jgi:hypothetical protein
MGWYPHGSHHELASAGHYAMDESPLDLLAVAEGFLREDGAGTGGDTGTARVEGSGTGVVSGAATRPPEGGVPRPAGEGGHRLAAEGESV